PHLSQSCLLACLPPTDLSTLSLHDALPILFCRPSQHQTICVDDAGCTTTTTSPSPACDRRSDQVEGCPPHAHECGETLGTDRNPEAHCGDQGSASGTG